MPNPFYDSSPETIQELINCAVQKMDVNLKDRDLYVVYLVLKVKYTDEVSCSHSCPFGEETNWGGYNDPAPRAQPGWGGRVWLSFCNRPEWFGSDDLHGTGIHSGTGGGGLYGVPHEAIQLHPKFTKYRDNSYGHYPMSWDTRIFQQDFPDILDDKQHKLECNMTGDKHHPKDHFAYYINPEYATA